MLQDTFLGEIVGAVILADDQSLLRQSQQFKPVRVVAEGVESTDGQTVVDEKQGKLVRILENVDAAAYYDLFANQLGSKKQSAVVGSFAEQTRTWSQPKNQTDINAS